MATYGLKTYKADGVTTVLQNSSKSGVFGEAYQILKTGTAGSKPPISFPQYTGRTIRPMQLLPGAHSWSVTYPLAVPTITFVETGTMDTLLGDARFYYDATVLYIFVK